MNNGEERQSILEDELLIVRNSGEIPEIALHSSFYYLTTDQEGPGIELTEPEKEELYNAAEQRYHEIVLRDIDPLNRDLRIYRGLARTIANWNRYCTFCARTDRDCTPFRSLVSQKLITFLCREYKEVCSGERRSSINCDRAELMDFIRALDVDPENLPIGWQIICPEAR